jgi:malonate-semialdehyde dehydrogenase (acetylating) / methylmalonate-semialdehyde dehydrogenase
MDVLNYVGGEWRKPRGSDVLAVRNPATGQTIGSVAMSGPQDVGDAVDAALRAFPAWRLTPPGERVQCLFRLKPLLEARFAEIARGITEECGKTLAEAEGELRRGIENVEVAAGIPSLLMGAVAEDIAPGIDELMIRQPVGVVVAITPFNFPGMIPLWFLPYAVATGNCFIAKPSERVPLTMRRLAEAMSDAGFPPGVVNVVNGGKEAVDALIDHPGVRAVSFVGSTPVARHVYARAAASGKRCQAQGGAKNAVVILPDADMEMTTKIVADSAFGCAGQRCLAASVAVAVGEAQRSFTERMAEAAASRKVGNGLDPGVEMGPVITAESRARIESLIGLGQQAGAHVLVDGRRAVIDGCRDGFFVRPTILTGLPARSELMSTEIFGPVLSVAEVDTLDEAIARVNASAYGNMACLFTSSGAAARKFRYEVQAGNVGINVGVAAPMAFFPFSGWRESFFGDLHAQGRDAIDFYTEKKIVVERWPREWSRRF